MTRWQHCASGRLPIPLDGRSAGWRSGLTALVLALGALSPGSPIRAHDAPSGWGYDAICCSDRDCAPIAAGEVEATSRGWRIKRTGEVIAYALARHSPDGAFHRCSAGGRPNGRTICLYVPRMGY